MLGRSERTARLIGLVAALSLPGLGASAAACSDNKQPTVYGGGPGNGQTNDDGDGEDAGLDATPSSDTESTTDSRTVGGSDVNASCWDVGTAVNPTCSAPSSCPAPNNSKEPTITCYTPKWVPSGKDVKIHLYGKYLKNEDKPPSHVPWRYEQSDFGAWIASDLEVKSNCHVVVTIPLSARREGCGQTFEFAYVRREPKEDAGGNDPGNPGKSTSWNLLRTWK